jgi:tRNA A37 threonylcarbamoyladenosine synthetase subunit TsaC/SUA5/YrdC
MNTTLGTDLQQALGLIQAGLTVAVPTETVYGLATGEAQAHLRYLHFAGRIKCEIRDGVGWYHAA